MTRAAPTDNSIFLHWLAYGGAVMALLAIAADTGALAWVHGRDPSHLSLVVGGILVLGLVRGAWVSLRLHREAQGRGGGVLGFLSSSQDDQAVQVLTERIRGPQELGWFLAGLATKLGLLGTVIGFIFMMGAVTQAESFDIDAAQTLIRQMTSGIGVALTTTLAGLSVSVLLGVQSFMLERFGETLIAGVVEGVRVDGAEA
ncbi:MAG: MotA/TolQ/ExbB proton channel family protein [Magnetospiraceae bacterium]